MSGNKFEVGTRVGCISTGKFGTIISEVSKDVWVVEWDDELLSKISSDQLKPESELEADFVSVQNQFDQKVKEATVLLREAANILLGSNCMLSDRTALDECDDAMTDCLNSGWQPSHVGC